MSAAGGLAGLTALACALAGASGTCLAGSALERRRAAVRRRAAFGPQGVAAQRPGGGPAEGVLRYAVNLSRRLSFGATRPLAPMALGRRPRSSARFDAQARKAGVAEEATCAGCREAAVRLALAFGAAGALVGAVLSNELMALLGAVGLAAGGAAPRWALREARRRRTREVERCLSEMLEVVALGLRSGLSFDRSFELYGAHFDSPLAHACTSARRRWSLGLSTREDALRDLASSYDSDQLSRVMENVVRSLRFGSSLAESLEAAAGEARAEHRARMEERAAKAPVKMMMPTGALILPAMLLLVLGPILLELADGF